MTAPAPQPIPSPQPQNDWTTSAFMAVCAAVVVLLVICLGLYFDHMLQAIIWAVIHIFASITSGLFAGTITGPNAAVGAHLGVYNVASPLAMYFRVRWLRVNRIGFLTASFYPVAVGGYVILMTAAWVIGRT